MSTVKQFNTVHIVCERNLLLVKEQIFCSISFLFQAARHHSVGWNEYLQNYFYQLIPGYSRHICHMNTILPSTLTMELMVDCHTEYLWCSKHPASNNILMSKVKRKQLVDFLLFSVQLCLSRSFIWVRIVKNQLVDLAHKDPEYLMRWILTVKWTKRW